MSKKSAKVNLNSELLYLLAALSIITTLLVSSYNLNSYLNKNKVLGAKAEAAANAEELKEKEYWESVVSDNPTYIDGWIEISKLSLSLGDKDYAIGAYNTAREINPNSLKVKELERLLNLKGDR